MSLFVSIVLGSESDKAKLDESGMLKVLADLGIGYEVYACSAHRNEKRLGEYCTEKVKHGVRVFIAIAGLSAALGGSITAKIRGCRPVLAVGLSANSALADFAALLATTMLPKFAPVNTIGMDKHGLINAALCAAQILAVSDDELFVKLQGYIAKNTPEANLLAM